MTGGLEQDTEMKGGLEQDTEMKGGLDQDMEMKERQVTDPEFTNCSSLLWKVTEYII